MKIEILKIEGELEEVETYFTCGHAIDDLAGKIEGARTPETILFHQEQRIKLIANPKSAYGFTSIWLKDKNNNNWEYSGFGHSGACSVVAALLKELKETKEELIRLKEENNV